MPTTLRETGTRLGEAKADRPSRREVTIITEGWGSSGFYSRELLERDGPTIFPVGTQMFLDHPGRAEETDRPERSVKDLAGRIASTPRMVGKDLVAEAEIYEHWRPVIDALAEDIGLSIRASGERTPGEAEGREGLIVQSLDEGVSVDFVTKAGRGGKVGKLIESAQASARTDPEIQKVIAEAKFAEARNAGNWFEARIHASFTETADRMFGDGYLTRDERIGLSSAIGEALSAFNAHIETNFPHLYARDPYADPDRAATVTEAANERRQIKEATMAENDRLKALEESVSTIKTQLTEAETRAAGAETRLAESVTRAERAEEALAEMRADKIVREATIDVDGNKVSVFKGLRESAVARCVKAALGESLPKTEDGKLDEAKLTERAVKAAKEERDYLAEHSSNGRVQGFGTGHPAAGSEDATKDLTEAFKGLGLDDKQALAAATGR